MKKVVLFLLCLALLAPLPCRAAESGIPFLSAECAVLYEAETATLLYGKNADRRHPMASTTKIMTALVAIEALPPDTVITIPKEATGIEGSSVYLKEGERYTLEALLYALLLQSANDAAEAIALAVAGSIEAFSSLMNQKAASLSLTDTHFENPHGLDGKSHYTTASELAIITCCALKNEQFSKICATRRYVFASIDGENPRTLINHNKMLLLYEGACGVKTGYTKKCGRCLVSAAEREGLTLVSVTLDAPSDWHDHTALLDYGFEHYERRALADAGALTLSLPVLTGGTVTVTNKEPLSLLLPKGAPTPTPIFDLAPYPVAPITAGEPAGSVTFRTADGQHLATSPMIFTQSISAPKPKKGWFGFRR